MILPPQFINDVRREEDIIFCPNCSRILYYFEERLEDEELIV
jgi:predicted  nucleic acid-binding Zn-ribbon protein